VPRPLPVLPPGPWRSSGRVLDYERWTERERWLELDRLIEVWDARERAGWAARQALCRARRLAKGRKSEWFLCIEAAERIRKAMERAADALRDRSP